MVNDKRKFDIFFLATDSRNQSEIPRKLIQTAHIVRKTMFAKPAMRPMFEVQYNEFRLKAMRKFKLMDDKHSVMIFCNGKYMLMSELMEILKRECPVYILEQELNPTPWYSHLTDANLVHPQRDYVYLNIIIKGQAGYLIIEIFTDINPRVCKSFMKLLLQDTLSIGYYHSFKSGWFEFGIGGKSMPARGNNHHKLMSHNKRGIFSFSEDFNNECDAFFIHFTSCTFFDDKRTVLGRVVHGDELLKNIENLEDEFGRISDLSFKIKSLGIVPIGRNTNDISQENWEDCVNKIFGVEKITILTKMNEPISITKQEEDFTNIICPMIQKPVDDTYEIFGEGQSKPSGYSTPDTPNPEIINEHFENLVLNYEPDDNDLFQESFHSLGLEPLIPNSNYDDNCSFNDCESPRSITDIDCKYSEVDPSDGSIQNKERKCPSIGSYMS